MTAAMGNPADITYRRNILILIGVLLAARVIGLFLSPLNLHGDEAQYWAWSKTLDFGYFSKPPMIAWVIAATTSVFGDAEWAVRLSSPVLHSVTAYLIFLTARLAYDGRTGFWAAAVYILMPAVWLSSGIVSTDVPLLLCWIIALNAWLHLRAGAGWPRILQLGLAIGLGLMSKYAMLFFLPALVITILFDALSRKALLNMRGINVLILAGLCVLPNLYWNMTHDFATVTHTAANANLQGQAPFHPMELLSFWSDQLAVFGPVTFILLVFALWAAMRRKLDDPSLWIALFVLSPLLIISFQALISRANANWAVTAYVAASILTAHYGLKGSDRLTRWLKGGVIAQALICAVLVIILLVPSWTNAAGLANSVKRVRAWPETVAVLADQVTMGHEDVPFEAIAFDRRINFYDARYYGLGDAAPLKMWLYRSHPENHAELTEPLAKGDGPFLIVNYHEIYEDELREDFIKLIALSPLDIDLGGGKRRQLKLWVGYGYEPTRNR